MASVWLVTLSGDGMGNWGMEKCYNPKGQHIPCILAFLPFLYALFVYLLRSHCGHLLLYLTYESYPFEAQIYTGLIIVHSDEHVSKVLINHFPEC